MRETDGRFASTSALQPSTDVGTLERTDPLRSDNVASSEAVTTPLGQVGQGLALGLAAAFVSLAAFLLIVIQPVAAAILLTATGGNPLLWCLAQVAFQALLLCGYVGASLVTFRSKVGLRAYGLLMLAGAAQAVLAPGGLAQVHRGGDAFGPIDVVLFVTAHVGLPIVALSTFSVAAQTLFGVAARRRTPYWLYASSNLGSLCAVYGYVLVVEPRLFVTTQFEIWRAAACGLLGVTGAGLLWMSTRRLAVVGGASGGGDRNALTEPLARQLAARAVWFLGGVGSVGLVLASTTFLIVEVGPNPVAWLAPLSGYLTTLALAFTKSGGRSVSMVRRAAPAAALLLTLNAVTPLGSRTVWLALHVTGVWIILAAWNGWLAGKRPTVGPPAVFYSCLAAGGLASSVLAGATPFLLNPEHFGPINAWAHRAFFDMPVPEYWLLILISSCAATMHFRVLDRGDKWSLGRRALAGFFVGGLIAASVGPVRSLLAHGQLMLSWAVLIGVPIVSAIVLIRSRFELALAIVTGLLLSGLMRHSPPVVQEGRSQYGVVEVRDQNGRRLLINGNTLHGEQELGCALGAHISSCSEPTGYYDRQGPLGLAVQTVRRRIGRMSVGVIGLGAGGIATYCESGDHMTFIEVDPLVLAVAERSFTYLKNARSKCGAVSVTIGDGRLRLRERPRRSFDFIVADAFSSDAIPIHLLTREAIAEFVSTVTSEGIVAFHLSNRHLDLSPVVVTGGTANHMSALALRDSGDKTTGRRETWWVFLGGSEQLAELRRAVAGTDNPASFHEAGPAEAAVAVWLDESHSILSVWPPAWTPTHWFSR